MWGSFEIHIDLPKKEHSEVTMEARLTNNPKIEVRTKSLGISKLTCGDHLGYILICQNKKIKK